MNKKLIALAVAGACVAPAAMAQTANPVTLYGKVYATLEWVEASGGTIAQDAATKRRTRVEDQASRLGVRGTEDLGGGLKAIFQLETAFRPDSNNTTFAARNSLVGLQGGWGTLFVGRYDTPFKEMTTAVDPYGDVTIGGIKGALNDQSNFDRRDQNIIEYWTPTWGGFQAKFQMQANEGKTATTDAKDYGGGVTYRGGPLYLFYTYEQHKDQVGNVGASAATAAGKKETGHAIGGTAKFGPIQVGVVAERIKKSDRTDQKPWMANIVYTMGNNAFSYQYETLKGGVTPGTTDTDCDVNVVGWQYTFSKRTFFLAQYARIKNNAVTNCGSNTFAVPGMVAGQDPKGMSLGLSHVF